jgi:hypothetical protein
LHDEWHGELHNNRTRDNNDEFNVDNGRRHDDNDHNTNRILFSANWYR